MYRPYVEIHVLTYLWLNPFSTLTSVWQDSHLYPAKTTCHHPIVMLSKNSSGCTYSILFRLLPTSGPTTLSTQFFCRTIGWYLCIQPSNLRYSSPPVDRLSLRDETRDAVFAPLAATVGIDETDTQLNMSTTWTMINDNRILVIYTWGPVWMPINEVEQVT